MGTEHAHHSCDSCHGHEHSHHNGHEHGHHEHEHHHEHGGLKRQIALALLTAVLLAAAIFVEKRFNLATWQLLIIYLIPYLLIGWGTIREAVEGLLEGDVFNEHFLMAIATAGALLIGFLPGAEPEFAEAVAVMLFFYVGEMFEHYAEGQSRRSISHLMDIRPDIATVERGGIATEVSPSEVALGEIIVVKPGEKVPLDGVVAEGSTSLNTVALTGESMPREATVGDEVLSGCVNLSGVIRVRVTKEFGESTVQKILNLVEQAEEHKSQREAFITRFARVYTPIVTGIALAVAFLPPMLLGSFAEQFPTWLYRALMLLVISCPCALVISVPLSFFGGIGKASRNGILVKGGNCFDALAELDTVVFDKTGTLTEGKFSVVTVHPEKCDDTRLLHLAAHVEHYSTHPIGAALREAFPEEATDGCAVSEVKEIAGHGVQALVGSEMVSVGNEKMMGLVGAQCRECHECGHDGTMIHVAIDGEYTGHIVISDVVKDGSAQAITDLKELGVKRVVMLTGDGEKVAEAVARKLGVDEYYSKLLPAEKVEYVERLSQSAGEVKNGKALAFVGDGINDAPVLARADVGVAMGGLGSDAAIEAADVVLMDDDPRKVARALRIARQTISIAKQNTWFAIGVKVLILVLAVAGLATMWMAVFADVGVTVLAVFNAMRALAGRLTTEG